MLDGPFQSLIVEIEANPQDVHMSILQFKKNWRIFEQSFEIYINNRK